MTGRPDAIRQAFWGLLSLSSADAVARKLRETGTKGARGSTMECPIAQYAMARGAKGVLVSPYWLEVDRYSCINSASPATSAMRKFMWNFDIGMYPDLEA